MFKYAFLSAVALLSATAGNAATTYFGENLTPGMSVSGAPVTAHDNFLAQLSGVSTEGFESFSQGDQPSLLTFNGSAGTITASFDPSSGQVCATNGCGGPGRFATAGTNYFDVSSTFTATFNNPIAAFGFYGTDVGDISGQLTVELLRSGGASTFLTVPHTIDAPDGSLIFYGIIDQANPFDAIRFGNTAAGADYFGFDELTIGDQKQVTGGVPEPASWAMMLSGFGVIGSALRRRQRVFLTLA